MLQLRLAALQGQHTFSRCNNSSHAMGKLSCLLALAGIGDLAG